MKRSVSHLQAISIALAGFALWVLSDACIKLIGASALPPYEVIAFLGLAGAIILLLKAGWRGEIRALWPKRPRDQMGRAVLTLACGFGNVIALKHLPLTIFYIMVFMSPLIVALLAAFFLSERLDWKKTAAILAGFAGVIIAIHPGSEDMRGDWIGYAAVSVSALAFSVNSVWLRRMTQGETVESLTFFTTLADMVAGFPLMLWHAAPVGLNLLSILFAAGALGIAGTAFYSLALKHTTAGNVAQFHYTQIITGALIGYFVWNEVPTGFLVAGSALIVAGGLYIAARARKMEMLAGVSLASLPPA